MRSLRVLLVQWAIILAAFALIVGILNLANVHLTRIRERQVNSGYSLILLVSLVLTITIVGYFRPNGTWSLWIFNNIQVPIESSLVALLAVLLLLAAIQLLRRRLNLFSVILLVTALVALFTTTPLFFLGELPGVNSIHQLLSQVLAVAGARGILLGVALGTILTGVRVLIGADRPYSG